MLRERLYFEDLIFRLESLICYRNLRQDPVLSNLDKLARVIVADSGMAELTVTYYDFISTLIEKAEELGLYGNIFKKYVIHLFLNDVNPFTVMIEKGIDVTGKSIYEMALKDMSILEFYMDLDLKNITEYAGYKEKILDYIPCAANENPFLEEAAAKKTQQELLRAFILYYSHMGSGSFANYPIHKYDEEHGLVGIKNEDKVSFSDLIGCHEQKERLIDNTEAFLNGHEADNILMTGGWSMGKVSCMKALADKYYLKGLRLIETDQPRHIPELLSILEHRGYRFIIFVDDLPLEELKAQCKYMKSVLTGGIGARPSNVLIYAACCNRPFILEALKDGADETVVGDEMFGLTLNFSGPSPKEYQDMVVDLARKKNLSLNDDFLREQALQWRANHSGRTPEKFIQYIMWELKKS